MMRRGQHRPLTRAATFSHTQSAFTLLSAFVLHRLRPPKTKSAVLMNTPLLCPPGNVTVSLR
jgi:hypothetical protein